MKHENDFDKAVKAKLESRTYFANEQSWAAAEKLIQQQEAGTRSGLRGYFYGLLAGVLVLAVTGWLLLDSGTGAVKNNTLAQQKKNTAGNRTVADSENNSGEKTQRAPQENVTTTGTPSAAAPNAPAATAAPNTAVTALSVATGYVPGQTNTKNSAAPAKQNGNRTAKNTTPAAGKKQAAGNENNDAGSTPEYVAASAAQPGSGEQAELLPSDPHKIKDTPPAQPESSSGNPQQTATESIAAAGNENDSSPETNTIRSATVPLILAVTNEETNDQESVSETVKTSSSSTTTVVPSNGSWFARGGIAYMPGFESGSTVGRSINPALGMGYSFGFSGRFRFEAGLQYTTIGHASDSSRIYTSMNYGFGLEQERTEIGLQRLHYVAMPIHLRVGLDAKNALLAGVTPHYLFTTESRVRTYNLAHNSITNDKTTRVFGYGQGLRTTDFLLSAGYARTIGNHFEIVGLFHFGLTDIKDNAYFRFDKMERHKNLQLLLHYTF